MEVERDGGARMSEPSAKLQFLFQKLVQVKQVFFRKNSSLLLALRLKVDGVFFFFFAEEEAASPLVSKEKEKLAPMFREKWKALPWVASAWQNSMHLG